MVAELKPTTRTPRPSLSFAQGAIFALVMVLCAMIIRNSVLDNSDAQRIKGSPFRTEARLTQEGTSSDLPDQNFVTEREVPQAARDTSPRPSAGQAEIVQVVTASSADAQSPSILRRYTGLVTPAQASAMGFKTTGRVQQLLVDQGDTVRKGDLLAVLETNTLEADKQVLAAELQAARAQLAELEAGPRQETIAAAEAKLKELQSRLELAQITSGRRTELFEADAGSRQAMDDARLQAEAAESQVDNQMEVVRELKAGTRSEKIEAQKAMVAQLLARLKRVDVDLEESRLLAPYDAVVSERMVDDGMIVSPGQTLFRVVQMEKSEAWVGLPAEVASGLKTGSKYPIELGDKAFEGALISVLPELDQQTRTQTAIFSLENSPVPTRFGEVVRFVHPVELKQTEGFWLPSSALTYGIRGLWAVYVVVPLETADQSQPASNEPQLVLKRHSVEILQTENARVLVRGTLREGDQVVAAGVQKLVAGQVVIVGGTSPEMQ